MNVFTRLNSNDFLKYLTSEEIQEFQECQKVHQFEKGNYIINENDFIEYIYCLQSGAVEVLKIDESGSEIVIETLHSGEIFGETSFVFRKSIYSARAKRKTVAKSYPLKRIEHLLRENPFIAAKIMAAVNDALTIKNIKITQKLSE